MSIIYLKDLKNNDIDRRRVSSILLTKRDTESLIYDPSKRLEFPLMYPGNGVSLSAIKKVAEDTKLNVYIRYFGTDTFIRCQLAELLGDEDGDQG